MATFISSISSVVVVILIIALGFILRQKKWFADTFAGNISKLIMQIALPASIFISVQTHLTRSSLLNLFEGLLVPAIGVFLSYLIAFILIAVFKIPAGRRGTFINTLANANTIFIGMPLNIALFGENAMSYFLIYYVINTVSTWAIGIFFMQSDSLPGKKKEEAHFNWKKLLPMPLLGFIVAILWLLTGISLPSFVSSTFTYVGNLVTPLSLIYIGIMLADIGLKNIKLDKDTILAVLGRLVIAPIIMLGLVEWLMPSMGVHMANLMKDTFIIQSATPALSVLPILADQGHGDVEYAKNVVAITTICFVVVVPVLMLVAS